MKLFSLFGEILIDKEKANQAMDDIDKKGQKAEGRLDKIIGTAGKVAAGLAAAGAAAVTALGVKAVEATDSFDKAMNDLSAQTGITGDELDEFSDIATRIYNSNLGESFQDIADAMANVRQTTGLTGTDLESVTSSALLLRDTFDYDVKESINTVNSLMKNFGITGEEAYTLIAQGAQQGADKNGDLLDSLNEYSVHFSQLGFDAETFTSVLIQGAENGSFSIDKIGDSIKEFSIRSQDLSKSSLEAFEALGLHGEEMSAQFAKGGEAAQTAFQQVVEALANTQDPLAQNAAAVGLFGTMAEDVGIQAITAFASIESQTDQTANTLSKINDVQYDSFGQALQGIGRNLETGVLVPLGERVLPMFDQFAGWIVEHMPEIQQTMNSVMDTIAGLFEGLAAAIRFCVDNANVFLPIVIGLTAAIAAQAIIGTINKLYTAWSTATKTQTTLQWLMNAAMKANPLGLVATLIGALVAAGVALYQNWDTVKEKLGQFWAFFKQHWDKIVAFTGPIGLLVAAGVALYKNWDTVKEKAQELGDFIGGFFSNVFGKVADGFKWYVNRWIDIINFLIRALNKIKFDLPDWIPGIGGRTFGINIGELPHLAKGTQNFPGGWAVVGEQGPELTHLPRGSQVIPHRESMDMLDGYKTANIVIQLDGRDLVRVMGEPLVDMIRLKTGLRI